MPAHTPINFVKGGGGAVFSANCIKLLADVGFSPEDFGSYNSLSKQIKQRRQRAKRLAAALKAKQARQGGTLSEADKARLETAERDANLEVAHLGQNGTRQRQRGNPCSNMVDGHEEGEFPCVLIGGPAFNSDRTVNESSEHGKNSLQENQHSRAVGPPDPSPREGEGRADARPPAAESVYPAERLAADERARCASLCSNRPEEVRTASAQDAGAMPDQPSPRQRKSLAEYEAALENRSKDGPQAPTEIDGETAAECIDTFKKMGVAAMNKKMEENADANARRAGSPEQRAQARQAAAEATQREQQANEALSAAKAERKSALLSARGLDRSPRRDPNHPDHAQWQQDRAAASTRIRQAQTDLHRAQRVADREAAAAEKARRRSSTMENAHCRARQGRRLASGDGVRTDGRVPWSPPPTEQPASGATGTGEVE